MTDITNLPLNKLAFWEGNVRKTVSEDGIDELAASIKAHGLLQSLVVRKQGKTFGVVAGGRRLRALQHLAAKGHIEKAYPVPCRIIASDNDATEISLAENVVRENMHPADQFEAFRDLIDKGSPVADVAARFGVTETIVRQRLKLGRVSPAILAAYRAEDITLEHVMAFTVNEDYAAQESVLANLRPWDSAQTIREALTSDEISASDRRVKFVTLKAYEKAGGTVRRDLFNDDDSGIFITDAALLDRMVKAKLDRAAKPVIAEGWKWVETRPAFGYEERAQYQRRHPEPTPLSDELAAEEAALTAELQSLEEAYYADDEAEERPARMDAIEARLEEIDSTREDIFPAEVLAVAGAVLFIGNDGKLSIDRGLVRPEDAPKQTGKAPKTAASGEPEAEEATGLSATLIESLTAERSAAIIAALKDRPDVALAALVHTLAMRTLYGHDAIETSLSITAKPQSLQRVEGTKASKHIEEARTLWLDRLPGLPADLWQWCLEQDQAVLLDLLAFCTALTINAVMMKQDRPDSNRIDHAGKLAAALDLDMATWFKPTADNYFGRISKPLIIEALNEARAQPPAPAWLKLKKGDLATIAEREIAGTGWLPVPLRPAG